MRIDLDTYREILDTLTRNKSRSFLTGFGVFWGVFMLVFLIGGGKGLQDMLESNFEGFATNSAFVWPSSTSKPYAGFKKGRSWTFTFDDAERLKAQVPELDLVLPMLVRWGTHNAVYGANKFNCGVQGYTDKQPLLDEPRLRYGRYINAMDMAQRRKVCVIGKEVYQNLFPEGGDPCGKAIRVDSIYYTVVGVNFASSNINIGGSASQMVIFPLTLMQQTYNYGNEIDQIGVTGKPGVKLSDMVPRIREVLARPHKVDPTDEQALSVVNTEAMFTMVDMLFQGVNLLILLVGIGTLLAGAIGVSNIMMVTVRERTVEIGIRRAIGATPRMILSQIMAESLVLTFAAGMAGILFAVIILQMLQLGTTTDGIVAGHFQVTVWTALGASLLLAVLGSLAGLAPALRAMKIKPVDAMRDE